MALVLLQVWVFNQIHLFGLITPLLYIYFILKLSTGMNRNAVVIWAFAIGLCIDTLDNTPGLNALASTIVGFFRFYLLRLMFSREEDAFVPSFSTLKMPGFVQYASILILLHHTILFMTEAASVYSFGLLMLKILGGTVLSLLLVFALESFHFEPIKA